MIREFSGSGYTVKVQPQFLQNTFGPPCPRSRSLPPLGSDQIETDPPLGPEVVKLSTRSRVIRVAQLSQRPIVTAVRLRLGRCCHHRTRCADSSVVLRMAGSFSGHLVDSFLTAQNPRGPFGQHSPQISTHGPLAFAPNMHGTFSTISQQSESSLMMDSTFMSLTEDTARKIATLQAKLDKKLGPEFISQRPGPGGNMKLTYAEGWKIINLANEVFGFNGWSSSVVSLTTDFIDFSEETKRYTVGVTAIVRVMLRDGVFHEDIGYGALENAKSKGAALDKVSRGVVRDLDSLSSFPIV